MPRDGTVVSAGGEDQTSEENNDAVPAFLIYGDLPLECKTGFSRTSTIDR